jgi:hypothetical protein
MKDLSKEQINTAMKDPNHLKKWLQESKRNWMVFNTKDLINSMPWPAGAQALAEIVSMYRDHRRAIATGRVEVQKQRDDVTDQEVDVEVPIYKDETLEIEELDRAIRHLIAEASEKDPKWSLQNAPL